MLRVLVSACLLGEKVRYNGKDAASESPILAAWQAEGRIVPFCPEVAGGLPVPRPAAEIRGAGGRSVLEGRARVVTEAGAGITDIFLRGARLALETAQAHHVRVAVLKDGSPSCASTWLYDGSFRGQRIEGQGVTAALLERHGIRVFHEGALGEADAYLRSLERRDAGTAARLTTGGDT